MAKVQGGLYRNPGGRFWLYHFKWKGKVYKGTTGKESKPAAGEWLRKFRSQLADQQLGISPEKNPLVLDLWGEWLETHKPPRTSERHRARVEQDWKLHILPVFEEVRVSEITVKDVELLRQAYLEGDSQRNAHYEKASTKQRTNRSANRLVGHLHLVLGWGWKTKRTGTPPFFLEALSEQEPVRHFLRLDQVEPFLAALDRIAQEKLAKRWGENPNNQPTDALHIRIAVRAMLYMLLREDEALGLRWSGFTEGFQTYTPTDTKGGEATALPVPDDLIALLKIARERVKEGEWVLPAEDGEPHRGQFTRVAIRRAGEDIGAKGITPHRMRGTGATLLARSKANAFLIQKAGRWKDIKTAKAYVQVIEDDLRSGLDEAFGRGSHKVPEKIGTATNSSIKKP